MIKYSVILFFVLISVHCFAGDGHRPLFLINGIEAPMEEHIAYAALNKQYPFGNTIFFRVTWHGTLVKCGHVRELLDDKHIKTGNFIYIPSFTLNFAAKVGSDGIGTLILGTTDLKWRSELLFGHMRTIMGQSTICNPCTLLDLQKRSNM